MGQILKAINSSKEERKKDSVSLYEIFSVPMTIAERLKKLQFDIYLKTKILISGNRVMLNGVETEKIIDGYGIDLPNGNIYSSYDEYQINEDGSLVLSHSKNGKSDQDKDRSFLESNMGDLYEYYNLYRESQKQYTLDIHSTNLKVLASGQIVSLFNSDESITDGEVVYPNRSSLYLTMGVPTSQGKAYMKLGSSAENKSDLDEAKKMDIEEMLKSINVSKEGVPEFIKSNGSDISIFNSNIHKDEKEKYYVVTPYTPKLFEEAKSTERLMGALNEVNREIIITGDKILSLSQNKQQEASSKTNTKEADLGEQTL